MRYPEEDHARDLHRALEDRLSSRPSASVETNGEGVHWTCRASRGARECKVSCFDTHGPEYLASFLDGSTIRAWARTSSRRDILSAVLDWLDECALEELYRRHGFVEQKRRALVAIETRILELCPELDRPGLHTVEPLGCDLHDLWLRNAERSARVFFYGGECEPRAYFFWDNCQMFGVSWGDTDRLAGLIDHWLARRVGPSVVQTLYPDLVLEPIAKFYEEGRPIEGEFLLSWSDMEAFFAKSPLGVKEAPLAIIAAIRRAGLDRSLRAGQSLATLMISRSRRHGLRPDQPFIALTFHATQTEIHVSLGGKRTWMMSGHELTAQLVHDLEELGSCPID